MHQGLQGYKKKKEEMVKKKKGKKGKIKNKTNGRRGPSRTQSLSQTPDMQPEAYLAGKEDILCLSQQPGEQNN